MAASVQMNPIKGLGTRRKNISITFFPDGANAPVTNSWQIKDVTSITRNSAGKYTILLSNAYQQILAKHCSYQKTSAAALWAQFGDAANIGTSSPFSIVVRLINSSGTETEAAAFDANQSVSVTLEFNDSTA